MAVMHSEQAGQFGMKSVLKIGVVAAVLTALIGPFVLETTSASASGAQTVTTAAELTTAPASRSIRVVYPGPNATR